MIQSAHDLYQRKVRRLAVALGGVILVAASLAVLHFQVMDLGVFWIRLMRRLAI
jgi:hypothetical protein